MTELRLTFEFHGPFRISTGESRTGIATTVHEANLLPPSSVKGLMRSCARDLLRLAPAVITAVFGGRDQHGRSVPTPWHWGTPVFEPAPEITTRARIAIDSSAATATQGAFFLNEEVWAKTAHMRITLKNALDRADQQWHRAVLACSAAGVHSLGADRRRGLGWVSVHPEPAIDESALSLLDTLVESGGVHG